MARKKPSRPAAKASPKATRAGKASQLRIIGGEWRSRRLPIASVPGLRPTPDRVRETLFNWLQITVPGARCLDLFAGSGALGFEALSRGAATVVMVEKHPAAFAQLQANRTTLQADDIELLHTDGLAFLQTSPKPFDLIFLDPPFRQGLVSEALQLIREHNLLSEGGVVYLEYEAELEPDLAIYELEVFRQTTAGQVMSVLLR